MKKAQSRRRASRAKIKKTPPTIGAYLAGIPESSRKTFNELRTAIRSAVPAKRSKPSATAFPLSSTSESWFGSLHLRTTAVCSPPPP